MFAVRLRKRHLACEQLEGRFAPSSVLIGGGGRSTFRDAKAMDSSQAEQAAFFLAASAVMSQSTGSANVAPITFDQPAAGEAESKMCFPWSSYGDGTPPFPGAVWQQQTMFCMTTNGCRAITYMAWSLPPMQIPVNWGATEPTADGTASDGQEAVDFGVSTEMPSSNPSGTDNASIPSSDAAAVGDLPSEEQSVGVDTPLAVNTEPSPESSPTACDDATNPTSIDNVPVITDALGEAAVDAVTIEPQSEYFAVGTDGSGGIGVDAIATHDA